MEEQIVSFETAEKLGKIGFINGSRYYYDVDTQQLIYNDGAIYINGLHDFFIEAPTQSLAQKWLREVHNIVITCASMYENEKNENIIYWFWIQGSPNEDENDELSFKTYEEALEAGLQDGLKLIRAKQKL